MTNLDLTRFGKRVHYRFFRFSTRFAKSSLQALLAWPPEASKWKNELFNQGGGQRVDAHANDILFVCILLFFEGLAS